MKVLFASKSCDVPSSVLCIVLCPLYYPIGFQLIGFAPVVSSVVEWDIWLRHVTPFSSRAESWAVPVIKSSTKKSPKTISAERGKRCSSWRAISWSCLICNSLQFVNLPSSWGASLHNFHWYLYSGSASYICRYILTMYAVRVTLWVLYRSRVEKKSSLIAGPTANSE